MFDPLRRVCLCELIDRTHPPRLFSPRRAMATSQWPAQLYSEEAQGRVIMVRQANVERILHGTHRLIYQVPRPARRVCRQASESRKHEPRCLMVARHDALGACAEQGGVQ